MSAREKLEEIKREREKRLKLLAADNAALPGERPRATSLNSGKYENKEINRTVSSKPAMALAVKPYWNMGMATPPPPTLSLKDLSISTANKSAKAESILSTYWDRNASGFENCNSYTNISYEDRGRHSSAQQDLTPKSGGSFSTLSSKVDQPSGDIITDMRRRSEAALRASLDPNLELNIRRLNWDRSVEGSNGGSCGPRGFVDDDGLIEPDEDSVSGSVSRYSTANNISNSRNSKRLILNPSFVVGGINEISTKSLAPKHHSNAPETAVTTVLSEIDHDNSFDTVEQRINSLSLIWKSISDRRIAAFVERHGHMR